MNHRALWVVCVALTAGCAVGEARDVTFLSTSDSHYRQEDHPQGSHNALNVASIEAMNGITQLTWPEKLGGGAIATPRGVLALGDLIDNGDSAVGGRQLSAEQYAFFEKDFGLTGKDGLLHYPVYDGWGNHDGPPVGKEKNGFSMQAKLLARNKQRGELKLATHFSPNGLHYSWDWDDVHFVQLNLYPADRQDAGIKYNPVWHDPQLALSFLKQDLADQVGSSGRPVVLMSHCGFDTDWWSKDDWKRAYDVAKGYNVILYIYGHTGTGLKAWAPDGEAKKWDCINDGQTDKGFFVIQLTDDRIRAAYRIKSGLQAVKDEKTKATRFTWGGQWEWKYLFDRKLVPATK
ncbi:MAG: hypothetical protein RIR91_1580 [Verrucomicrobiota bacterium]